MSHDPAPLHLEHTAASLLAGSKAGKTAPRFKTEAASSITHGHGQARPCRACVELVICTSPSPGRICILQTKRDTTTSALP